MAEFIDNIKIAFPWYENPNDGTRRQKGTFDCYKHITSPATMPPSMIPVKMKPLVTPPLPTVWGIYDLHGTLELNLTPYIGALWQGVYEPAALPDGSFNAWLIHPGVTPIPNGVQIPCGYHESRVIFQGKQYTSELFYVPPGFNIVDPLKRYMRVSWRNSSDLMGIVYQTGFRNILLLESELTKMSPEIQEEGVEDGNGRFYPTSQRFVENLRFDEWAPQYLVDALTAAQMHDDVQVEIPIANVLYNARNIKTTATFDTPSNFGLVDFIFQSDAALFSGVCSDNFKLSAGGGAECNIVITNLTVSGTGNTKTFLFKPLQNGQSPINVLRYEWRSPQKYNGAWQVIDLNTTFGDSFTTGQNTVCVRAICPNSTSPEVCVNFTVSLPASQCPTGIQVYNVTYEPLTGDTLPVAIYYSLTGVTTNAKFIEINAPEISQDWQRYPITPSGTPQYIYYPDDTAPGEYVVQMRVVCVIGGSEYLSVNTNFVITLQ